MKVSRGQAWRLKNISVYIGIAGYLAMIVTGSVLFGAITKLIAESLRIPYFMQTDARDMVGMSVFFIMVSFIAIFFLI